MSELSCEAMRTTRRALPLLLLLASACIDKRRPPVPSAGADGCVISGTTSLGGVRLSLGSAGDAPRFAVVPTLGQLVVDVTRFEPNAPHPIQVMVHTPLEGAGLRIHGWIDRADLSFRAKKKLAVGALALDEGAALKVAAVKGQAVRLDGAEGEVACDAVTLGEASVEHPELPHAPREASWVHQRAKGKAKLFTEPRKDAPEVGEVDDNASLYVRDGSDGWSQVLPANDLIRRYDPRKDLPAGQALGFWALTSELR
jgi:hypothetical protein